VIIQVDGNTLVQNVSISAEIPEDEGDLIKDLFGRIKADQSFHLEYPTKHDNLWSHLLPKAYGSGFTMKDDYPELFFDLD
jgi:hypothetical protein